MPVDFIEFDAQILTQHAHQRLNFVTRAFPVLGRKSVESQGPESQSRTGIDCGAHGLDSRAMAGDARLAAPGRPAAVAVHYDRYVPRQAIPINRRKQKIVARAFVNHFCEVSKHLFAS